MIGDVSDASEALGHLVFRLEARPVAQHVQQILAYDVAVASDVALVLRRQDAVLHLLAEDQEVIVVIFSAEASQELGNSRIF